MSKVFQICTKLFNFKVLLPETEMSVTHVLLTCENSNKDSICQQIQKMNHVKEVSRTSGAYTMIVKIESNSEQDIRETISNKIRRLKNIVYPMTLTSNESYLK